MTSAVTSEKVRIGALILGRGGVNQYSTQYYIDRRQQQNQAWSRVVQDCFPCFDSCSWEEPRLEGHPGKPVILKSYVEDVEQAIYNARHLDSLGQRKEWRITSSGITFFLLLTTVFLVGSLKVLMSSTEKVHSWLTLIESVSAFAAVVFRSIQILVLYWQEREVRRSLEVTAWGDGTVTRGRPLSLFILIWIYGIIQVFACAAIICGSMLFTYHSMRTWTLLSNGVSVFLISEFLSALLHRHLDSWRFQVKEDHLKLTLLEASDLFEDAWRKTRDDDMQNRVYRFKEAAISTFRLDTLRLAYIRK